MPGRLRPGGARLHSNSWGADVSGAYTANSAAADDFVWRHPEMTLIFSAGNRGVDKNSDGFVDSNSIEAPATAKNVIAVGASENDRAGDYPCDTTLTYPSNDPFQAGQTCAAMGGQNALGTYGVRWPDAFPVEPIFGDVTAGNSGQMAAFSGRGPTDDGRIKPDVVAPGTWLLSGYSELYRQGYDPEPNSVDGKFQLDGWGFPAGDRYKYFGGTSMAAPLVAGAATVVRDRYQRDFDHAASAALVKATLINTAVDLPDENNDGVNDNDFPIPNIHEGWGRVRSGRRLTQVAAFVDDPVGHYAHGRRPELHPISLERAARSRSPWPGAATSPPRKRPPSAWSMTWTWRSRRPRG
ncbi:MAG: S8 family serine peptidase [Caldilineaceae bacterium]